MTDRRDIEYRTDMDAGGFRRGVSEVRSGLSTMMRGTRDSIRSFVNMDEIVTGSLRRIGESAVDMGTDMARSAGQWVLDGARMADQADTIAVSFEKVFGAASAGLRTNLNETRRSMGLARQELESMLLPIGQMATNAGFAAQEAGSLSSRLVTLAGDVGAFNPLVGTAEEALGAMQAALRGEFDPLERFGSKLSAARVEAEVARLRGVDPLNESLSDQELRIKAVVELLEQDLAPALGALARQEGETADNMKEAEADAKDLQTAFGRLASPTLQEVTGGLADVTSAMVGLEDTRSVPKRIGDGLQTLFETMVGGLAGVVARARGANDALSEQEQLAALLAQRIAETNGAIRSQDELVANLAARWGGAINAVEGYADAVRNVPGGEFRIGPARIDPFHRDLRRAGTGPGGQITYEDVPHLTDVARGRRQDETRRRYEQADGRLEPG